MYLLMIDRSMFLRFSGFVHPTAEIAVQMELMAHSTLHTFIFSDSFNDVDWVIPLTLSLCFCYIWALPLLDFGLGHETAYNRLEVISGMRFGTLCIAYFIYGILVILISIVALNGIMFACYRSLPMDMYFNCECRALASFINRSSPSPTAVIFNYTILVSGACIMSINILFSFWLAELRIGYILLIAFYSIGIVFHLSASEVEIFKEYGDIAKLNMFPNYALFNNLMRLNYFIEITELCKDDVTYKTSVFLEHCDKQPNCCCKYPHSYSY